MSKTVRRAIRTRRVRGNIWDHGLKDYFHGETNKQKRNKAKRDLRREVQDF